MGQCAQKNKVTARWLVVCDIDGTFVGDERALAELIRITSAQHETSEIAIVLNSSRPRASVDATLASACLGCWTPLATITAMGTEISIGSQAIDAAYQARFGEWDRSVVDRLAGRLAWAPHPEAFQTRFKASYSLPTHVDQQAAREHLAAIHLPCMMVVSGAGNLDVLPPGAGKGAAMMYLADRLEIDHDHVLAAGDSCNDLDMLLEAGKAILVSNACHSLQRSMRHKHASYLADTPYASGILEGLRYFGVVP